ncbi:MAG: amidase family protein [Acidimicrobiia bacterium]|nr:amidase family protein [Acidimicrobiia bacterium]
MSFDDELAGIDGVGQADLVRRGDVTPAELVGAAVVRMEKLNPRLNAVIRPTGDQALDRANGDLPDGPLRGVPIVMKDLGLTIAGEEYHEGVLAAKEAGFVAPVTSDLAARFLAAGLVSVGKTNTPELGLVPTTEPVAYGASHNPWNVGHTTGGSSGGSAAAVAAGIVPIGHANDGGGSIRIPASCCGLVGLKPSRGRMPLGPALDPTISPIVIDLCVTRTVRDTAAVLDATHGASAASTIHALPAPDSYLAEVGADPGRLRIGVLGRDPRADSSHPEVDAAIARTIELLAGVGHEVSEDHPDAIADESLVEPFVRSWALGCYAQVMNWSLLLGRDITSECEPMTRGLAEIGQGVTGLDTMIINMAMWSITQAVDEWFRSGFDVLLTPTVASPPVPLGTIRTDEDDALASLLQAGDFAAFTPLQNVTGQPAISLPLAESADGLPIGMHFVARHGREDLLLRLAGQLEDAAPWAARIPAVHA